MAGPSTLARGRPGDPVLRRRRRARRGRGRPARGRRSCCRDGGSPTSRRTGRSARFRAFAAGLARERTVIRYDRVGTGLVGPGAAEEHMTLAFEVRTLEAVIDALELARFDLLGISYGGGGRRVLRGAPSRPSSDGSSASARTPAARTSRRPRCAPRCSTWCARTGASARACSPRCGCRAPTRPSAPSSRSTSAAPPTRDRRRAARARVRPRRAREPRATPAPDPRAAPARRSRGAVRRAPSWPRSSRGRACSRSTAARTRRGTATPRGGGGRARVPARRRRAARRTRPPTAGDLSAREREVLRLVASGLSDAQIAAGARPQPAHGAPARREHPREAAPAHARGGGCGGGAPAADLRVALGVGVVSGSRGTRSRRARGGGRPRSR